MLKRAVWILWSVTLFGSPYPLWADPAALSGTGKSPLPTEVLSLAEGATSPEATIDLVRWLEGSWEGTLEGAMQQHVALAPVSGHMPGFVRAWGPDGSIWFYEINVLAEVGESLEFRVKHFSSELAGWEGKDEFVRHPLVAFTDQAVFFHGITFVKNGPDSHIVYFRIPEGERKGQIIVVHQTRVK